MIGNKLFAPFIRVGFNVGLLQCSEERLEALGVKATELSIQLYREALERYANGGKLALYAIVDSAPLGASEIARLQESFIADTPFRDLAKLGSRGFPIVYATLDMPTVESMWDLTVMTAVSYIAAELPDVIKAYKKSMKKKKYRRKRRQALECCVCLERVMRTAGVRCTTANCTLVMCASCALDVADACPLCRTPSPFQCLP